MKSIVMNQKLYKDFDQNEDYTFKIPALYSLANFIDLEMYFNVSIMDGLSPMNYNYRKSLIDHTLVKSYIEIIDVKIKLYHYIDLTNEDFYSFGSAFTSDKSDA